MRFGSREIVDVVFKATRNGQKLGNKTFQKYQPVFKIDTATTSSVEQATNTVYAQGGRGNARLIAWEGEKTITFTVEDALMSPQGLAVLTGAGIATASQDNAAHVHVTIDTVTDEDGIATVTLADLQDETGLTTATSFLVCADANVPAYATKLDTSGAGIDYINSVVIGGTDAAVSGAKLVDKDHAATFTMTGITNAAVQVDFYLIMTKGVTTIEIKPEDFGGYFYVEAQTLYRREDTGEDMAAELIFPRIKVQSPFTLTMAASGDPSTFTFTMDAFPGYIRFNSRRKTIVDMQILGVDSEGGDTVVNNEKVPVDTPTGLAAETGETAVHEHTAGN